MAYPDERYPTERDLPGWPQRVGSDLLAPAFARGGGPGPGTEQTHGFDMGRVMDHGGAVNSRIVMIQDQALIRQVHRFLRFNRAVGVESSHRYFHDGQTLHLCRGFCPCSRLKGTVPA